MSRIGDTLRSSLLVAGVLSAPFHAYAEEGAATDSEVVTSSAEDQARDALQQKDTDVTQERNLEEVFQATEKQYSLLRAGEMSMQFGGNYTYFRDDRIDINFDDSGTLTRFRIENGWRPP